MRNVPIQGSDVSKMTPINGVIHVAGIIRTPYDMISIYWEDKGSSGSTQCEAWRGQYEIDCLTRAGLKILSVSLFN
jgi:hypothetical protein